MENSKEEICEILLSKKKLLASAKYADKNGLDASVMPPRKFLEAALESGDQDAFYNLYTWFSEAHPQFFKKADCKYRRHFEEHFK